VREPKPNHGPWLDPKTIADINVPIIKHNGRLKKFRGGTLELRKRTLKPDVWVLHYTIIGAGAKKRVHHAIRVGTIHELPTREAADRAADVFRKRIREGCHLELRNAPKSKRITHYKSFYTAAQYQQRLVAQDGKCAICKAEPIRLHFDHDHSDGTLRGLLCSPCNCAIGMLRDSPSLCETAAAYLASYGK
jgi:hypothetical protein